MKLLSYLKPFCGPGPIYIMTALPIILNCVLFNWNQLWVGDFWQHAAIIRALAENPLSPSNPFSHDPNIEILYYPYLMPIALLWRNTSYSLQDFFGWCGILNISFLLIAMFYFLSTFSTARLFPALALILVACMWGETPWYFSSFYHSISLPAVQSYPSTFAFAVTLVTISMFRTYKVEAQLSKLLSVGVLSLLVLLVHPITFIFLSVFIFISTIAEAEHFSKIDLRGPLGVFAICLIGAAIWPFLSYKDLLTAGPLSADPNGYAMYMNVFIQTWPVFVLGAPLLIKQLCTKPSDLLSLSAIVFLIIYLTGYWTQIWNLGRTISFFCFAVQLVVATWLVRSIPNRVSNNRPRLPTALVHAGTLFPILFLCFLVVQFNLAKNFQADAFSPYRRYSFAKDIFKPDSLVLSDLFTSRYLPSLNAKVVAFDCPPFFKGSYSEREADLSTFFSSKGSTERIRILQKYNPAYLLVESKSLPGWEDQKSDYLELGDLLLEHDGVYLFDLKGTLLSSKASS